MGPAERTRLNRLYTVFNAIDLRQCSMNAGDGYKRFVGGMSSEYAAHPLHPTTFVTNLDEVYTETVATVTTDLKMLPDDCESIGCLGPFCSLQLDLTTMVNTEYCTAAVTFIPQEYTEIKRYTLAIQAFRVSTLTSTSVGGYSK